MVLLASAALTASNARAATDPPVVRVGLLAFGTGSWEVDTMRRFGLDRAAGVRVEPVTLASNDAARIALLGGAVDTIVGDLLWAARLRGEGRDLAFVPFSSTEGGLMVPAGSGIRSVADLRGKRLGVSGGPLDKTWLLLRAVAGQTADLDPANDSSPAFGAPPLLSQKLEAGELDAALLYWTFCARLEAKGFKRVLGVDDMLKTFGIERPISFLGYVFDLERLGGRATALAGLAAASRQAKARLATDADAWAGVRPLMQAPDDPTFDRLRHDFVAGIPERPLGDERADAARLYEILAKVGGERLVGATTRLPAGLYWPGPS